RYSSPNALLGGDGRRWPRPHRASLVDFHFAWFGNFGDGDFPEHPGRLGARPARPQAPAAVRKGACGTYCRRRRRGGSVGEALLEVRDLRTYIYTRRGVVQAVNGASFSVQRGETLGIVGESGSGKSMTCLSIMRLLPEPGGRIVGGEILFNREDLPHNRPQDMRPRRRA